MRMPDTVTVIRPTTMDEYGNAGSSWANATELPSVALWLPAAGVCLMPADADVLRGDRIRAGGLLYDVDDDPIPVRSPSRSILTQVKITRRI